MASVQVEETTPILPLHYISRHVLFPEETLPMHIYNPHVSKIVFMVVVLDTHCSNSKDFQMNILTY